MTLLMLASCADTVDVTYALEPVGFWYGLWHGMTAPIALVGSWFDDSIAVYAVYNNGGWYDFGFFLGASSSLGSSGAGATGGIQR